MKVKPDDKVKLMKSDLEHMSKEQMDDMDKVLRAMSREQKYKGVTLNTINTWKGQLVVSGRFLVNADISSRIREKKNLYKTFPLSYLKSLDQVGVDALICELQEIEDSPRGQKDRQQKAFYLKIRSYDTESDKQEVGRFTCETAYRIIGEALTQGDLSYVINDHYKGSGEVTNQPQPSQVQQSEGLDEDEITVIIHEIKDLRDRPIYVTSSLASKFDDIQNDIIADTKKSKKFIHEMLIRTFLDLSESIPEVPNTLYEDMTLVHYRIYMTKDTWKRVGELRKSYIEQGYPHKSIYPFIMESLIRFYEEHGNIVFK